MRISASCIRIKVVNKRQLEDITCSLYVQTLNSKNRNDKIVICETNSRLSLAVCVVLLIHLTLKYGSNTLLSLVNGSPRTTAFIIEILSCQVTLHTCHRGLKGTARAPLLCCSAWFFIALDSRPIHRCFQPYVNIIHFRMWQLPTVRHCTSSQNLVYITRRLCLFSVHFIYKIIFLFKKHHLNAAGQRHWRDINFM